MLKRFLLITSSLVVATSAAFAAPVEATLTGMDCSGDYCQLAFTVNNKAQTAICADDTYCEEWSEQETVPASVKAKPAKLTIESQHLEDQNAHADVVTKIEF
ncbi:hypothetical protein BKE30_11410 [Alkanindiges hydrocarboniclasticus]|jgi:hypothetical protein|uniref:Uncharacterized protein n=1 Tax=Alkanindiges hydrocarboniclasticus TaxID=1907941 RepID=A0A1S8CTH0_9GAMM|nr:hypothetical protein [Alkanindiges hydrocarboniclasticus]ONG38767.1 hypothetical protein BKE30_11410 [Alkanindiges hydrocarboniclasticus]